MGLLEKHLSFFLLLEFFRCSHSQLTFFIATRFIIYSCSTFPGQIEFKFRNLQLQKKCFWSISNSIYNSLTEFNDFGKYSNVSRQIESRQHYEVIVAMKSYMSLVVTHCAHSFEIIHISVFLYSR